METQAYADLKAARNAARAEYRPLSDSERSLKRAITSLTEAGQTEAVNALTAIRSSVQEARKIAQERKESLEAAVTEARAEYRAEKLAAYEAEYGPLTPYTSDEVLTQY